MFTFPSGHFTSVPTSSGVRDEMIDYATNGWTAACSPPAGGFADAQIAANSNFSNGNDNKNVFFAGGDPSGDSWIYKQINLAGFNTIYMRAQQTSAGSAQLRIGTTNSWSAATVVASGIGAGSMQISSGSLASYQGTYYVFLGVTTVSSGACWVDYMELQ